MELILKRIAKRSGYTIGRIYIRTESTEKAENTEDTSSVASVPSENSVYLCDTLEPPVLEMKTTVGMEAVMRSPEKARALKPFAIPEGRYAVVITYSPKMKQWLPLLLGVPMFSGIRIHAGNTAKDTAGCILVGENLKKGMVLNSRLWVKRVKEKIVEAKNRGEGVWLRVEQ